jgi:hypothetical protein
MVEAALSPSSESFSPSLSLLSSSSLFCSSFSSSVWATNGTGVVGELPVLVTAELADRVAGMVGVNEGKDEGMSEGKSEGNIVGDGVSESSSLTTVGAMVGKNGVPSTVGVAVFMGVATVGDGTGGGTVVGGLDTITGDSLPPLSPPPVMTGMNRINPSGSSS